MIDRLKSQQEKLITSERHEAWEHVARKLAHEIKNPLTPIQLIIDNLRSKYSHNINSSDKEKFENNLNTILNVICVNTMLIQCLRKRTSKSITPDMDLKIN